MDIRFTSVLQCSRVRIYWFSLKFHVYERRAFIESARTIHSKCVLCYRCCVFRIEIESIRCCVYEFHEYFISVVEDGFRIEMSEMGFSWIFHGLIVFSIGCRMIRIALLLVNVCYFNIFHFHLKDSTSKNLLYIFCFILNDSPFWWDRYNSFSYRNIIDIKTKYIFLNRCEPFM